jgi:hypothetical protein
MNRKSFSTISAISLTVLGALAAVGVSALALILQTIPGPAAADSTSSPGAPSQLERGAYLVKIMGCNDCHTPFKMTPRGPEPDMTRMLSGHPQDLVVTSGPALGEGPWVWAGAGTNTAYAGPWGVSFTANLTPDPETGLGKWTAETFLTTIRSGRHEGQGRPILPPMPWPMYRNATDEDLHAVFAFLQSIPPIHNRVPQPLDPPEVQ